MADNIEVKVEQLTSAIRGLYDKPTATVNDLNSALNSVVQKFETMGDATKDKLGQAILGDIRRVLDEKQTQLEQQLIGFESALRQVANNLPDPKLNAEITRIVNEVSAVYGKINNQETLLNNMSRVLDGSGTREELEKLKNELALFSRGFENITQTLNKNFNEFLNQVQSYSSRDDLKKIFVDIDNVANNTNAIISALAIIDHKYKDLTGLIDLVTRKENIFAQGLEELSRNVKSIEALSNIIHSTSTREDTNIINEKVSAITSFLNGLKAQIEASDIEDRAKLNELKESLGLNKGEILNQLKDTLQQQKSSNSLLKDDFAAQHTALSRNLEVLRDEISKLHTFASQNIDAKSDEMCRDIKSLMEDLERLKNGNENVTRSVDDNFVKVYDLIHGQLVELDKSIENKSTVNKREIVDTVSNLKEDIKSVLTTISGFKGDFADITKTNLATLKEPIDKAVQSIESIASGKELKQLSNAVDNIILDVKNSFEAMKDNFAEIAANSNIEVLQRLNDSIPSISDRLEAFRTHITTENSAHIQELKKLLSGVIEGIKASFEDTVSGLRNDFGRVINEDISRTMKIDMQNLSDHLLENVENIGLSVAREFNDHKVNIDELIFKVNSYEAGFKEKLDYLETTIETLSQDTCERVTDAINTNNVQFEDAINIVKHDVLSHVSGMGEQSRAAFAELNIKIEQLLRTSLTSINDNRDETLVGIEGKLERVNLQQIHNAKELMEELQNISSGLTVKMDNIIEMGDSSVFKDLSKLDGKIKDLTENSSDTTKSLAQIDDKIKDFTENSSDVTKSLTQIDDKIKDLTENSSDVTRFLIQIDEELQSLTGSAKHSDELINAVQNHIDLRAKEIVQEIIELASIKETNAETPSLDDTYLKSKLDELISGVEFLQKNISEEISESFAKQNNILSQIQYSGEASEGTDFTPFAARITDIENMLRAIGGTIGKMQHDAQKNYTYSMEDIESDLAKMRLSIEKGNSLNKAGVDDVRARLAHMQKGGPGAHAQDMRLASIENMLGAIMRKQGEEFNVNSFIDVFYENTNQTKALGAKIEALEDQLSLVARNMQKIIAYIEE